jgi:hypothetical protein
VARLLLLHVLAQGGQVSDGPVLALREVVVLIGFDALVVVEEVDGLLPTRPLQVLHDQRPQVLILQVSVYCSQMAVLRHALPPRHLGDLPHDLLLQLLPDLGERQDLQVSFVYLYLVITHLGGSVLHVLPDLLTHHSSPLQQ